MSIKDFFRITKEKLYITAGIFVFSIILAFLAVEAHLFFLKPLVSYFLNWSGFFSLVGFGFAGNIIILASWIIQPYIYSCLFVAFRSNKEILKPTLGKVMIMLAVIIIANIALFIDTGMGCPERQLMCSAKGSDTTGFIDEDSLSTLDAAEREKFNVPAISVPLTCRQVCDSSQYYEAFSEEIVVKRALLPIILGYLFGSLLVYYRKKRI